MMSALKRFWMARKQSKALRILENTAALLLALLVWGIAAHAIDEPIILPSPKRVLYRFFILFTESELFGAIAFSLSRIALGFAGGLCIGLLLAVLSSASHTVEVLLRPYLFTAKAVPVASFVVLALFWFSSGPIALVISFLMVLPIVYTNVLEGIKATDHSMLEMAEVYGLSFRRRFVYLYVPSIKTPLLSACRIALGLAWKAGIAAEIIGIPEGSLGEKLYLSKVWVETDSLLAYTLVIVTVSLLFEKLVMLGMRFLFRLWEKL